MNPELAAGAVLATPRVMRAIAQAFIVARLLDQRGGKALLVLLALSSTGASGAQTQTQPGITYCADARVLVWEKDEFGNTKPTADNVSSGQLCWAFSDGGVEFSIKASRSLFQANISERSVVLPPARPHKNDPKLSELVGSFESSSYPGDWSGFWIYGVGRRVWNGNSPSYSSYQYEAQVTNRNRVIKAVAN